jgi:Tfp pilus assembly protein PilV
MMRPRASSLRPRVPPAAVLARRRGSASSAFTLVEVLAAFVLLIIVLPAVAQGISICTKATGAARRQVVAATLADGKLGEILAYPQTGSQSGDFSPEYREYAWTASIVMRDEYFQEAMVVVSWEDATGPQSFALSSILYGTTTDSSSGTTGGTQ